MFGSRSAQPPSTLLTALIEQQKAGNIANHTKVEASLSAGAMCAGDGMSPLYVDRSVCVPFVSSVGNKSSSFRILFLLELLFSLSKIECLGGDTCRRSPSLKDMGSSCSLDTKRVAPHTTCGGRSVPSMVSMIDAAPAAQSMPRHADIGRTTLCRATRGTPTTTEPCPHAHEPTRCSFDPIIGRVDVLLPTCAPNASVGVSGSPQTTSHPALIELLMQPSSLVDSTSPLSNVALDSAAVATPQQYWELHQRTAPFDAFLSNRLMSCTFSDEVKELEVVPRDQELMSIPPARSATYSADGVFTLSSVEAPQGSLAPLFLSYRVEDPPEGSDVAIRVLGTYGCASLMSPLLVQCNVGVDGTLSSLWSRRVQDGGVVSASAHEELWQLARFHQQHTSSSTSSTSCQT
jgi:hypothetical protein